MLTIRLFPTGRKHHRTYRIVAAQKHRHVSKKYIEMLGWYNPMTKEVHLNKDRIKHYVDNNVQITDTVRSILVKHSII